MASQYCEKHDEEFISSVCITHCQLTCIKCVLEDHRHCSEVSTLKDATETYAAKLNRCIHKNKKIQGIVSSHIDETQNSLKEIDTMHDTLEGEIRSVFNNLILKLVACQTASLDELENIVAAKKQEPNDIIENLVVMKQSLDKSLTVLQGQDANEITDKTLSFLKQTEETISHMEMSDFIRAKPKKSFRANLKCAKLLENILDSDLSRLGTIYCRDLSPSVCLSSDVDQNIRYVGASLSTAQSDEQTGSEELTQDDFEFIVEREENERLEKEKEEIAAKQREGERGIEERQAGREENQKRDKPRDERRDDRDRGPPRDDRGGWQDRGPPRDDRPPPARDDSPHPARDSWRKREATRDRRFDNRDIRLDKEEYGRLKEERERPERSAPPPRDAVSGPWRPRGAWRSRDGPRDSPRVGGRGDSWRDRERRGDKGPNRWARDDRGMRDMSRGHPGDKDDRDVRRGPPPERDGDKGN